MNTIIEAAAALSDRPIRFRLVGGGQTHADAMNMAKKHGLGTVEFLPSVPYADLPQLISGADVVLGIFGTTFKASMVVPNKVYQALAAGRAVVTAGTPAISEFFREGEHLLTVPPGDPGALAGALRRLESDCGLRLRLSESAGKFVRSEFNSMKIAERLFDIIEEFGLS